MLLLIGRRFAMCFLEVLLRWRDLGWTRLSPCWSSCQASHSWNCFIPEVLACSGFLGFVGKCHLLHPWEGKVSLYLTSQHALGWDLHSARWAAASGRFALCFCGIALCSVRWHNSEELNPEMSIELLDYRIRDFLFSSLGSSECWIQLALLKSLWAAIWPLVLIHFVKEPLPCQSPGDC